jgi:hypothetical protein
VPQTAQNRLGFTGSGKTRLDLDLGRLCNKGTTSVVPQKHKIGWALQAAEKLVWISILEGFVTRARLQSCRKKHKIGWALQAAEKLVWISILEGFVTRARLQSCR